MTRRRRTIALDFDGVLVPTHGNVASTPLGPPMPGAKEAVAQLLTHGHTVVVFTTVPRGIVERWLRAHSFPPLEVTHRKRPFWVMVDDRAIGFGGCWAGVVEAIESFAPYWIRARERPKPPANREALIAAIRANKGGNKPGCFSYHETQMGMAIEEVMGEIDHALPQTEQRAEAWALTRRLEALLALAAEQRAPQSKT